MLVNGSFAIWVRGAVVTEIRRDESNHGWARCFTRSKFDLPFFYALFFIFLIAFEGLIKWPNNGGVV